MPWFPEIAGSAFCETVQLRRRIIERQQLPRSGWLEVLEPSNAEFIAALAAGNNSHHILQIGCGISTIALAAAARATGSYLLSIHTDKEKQEIIDEYVQYLGLAGYVKFITDEPRNVIPQYDGVDFVFFLDPGCYVELFDLLRLKHEAIVVADNALDETMDEYIKHVHRQPGIHSSTLPIGRGFEVTKILSWNEFNSGRVFYCEFGQEIDEANGCCSSGEAILSDRSFSSISRIKLNYSMGDILMQNSVNSEECDVSEEGFLSVSPFQNADDPNDAVDGQYSPNNNAEDPILNLPKPELETEESHGTNDFTVHFKNGTLYTEVTIEGPDQDMLLSDITTAFNEMGISVQQARISTEEKSIEDVFCVVELESYAPLDPYVWDTVRERMLERITAHRKK
ncbi:hypothetical protein SUGI_1028410 [Cryptomeria japonica]|uniref:uncharacterized protein LOC131041786 n=1 Tax=Cryptomeria japonica TaxID=3369 RepID=UPI002414A586|nr:uncharacterized protein LOC131041786 [Cryptomeria japonica]XP_057830979.2 uncharacterized protein LOC131041786 [Cryptomeria japonica]GLJ48766.1 hypothetical protein SUGI_1028410 [Cryptomeria japonica]